MGLVGEQGYPHQGRLDFIDNQVDARSSTIHVRAVFDNRDGRFTPGLFARIKLVANDGYDAILIDERAVGNDLGKKFVLVLKPDNTLEYRSVSLGALAPSPTLVAWPAKADGVSETIACKVSGTATDSSRYSARIWSKNPR